MALVFTLCVFAIMVFAILKKVDLKVILSGLILLLLIYLTVTGGSVLGDGTTGNIVIDWFAYIANYLSSNIGGVAFTIILVFSYVEVMNKLKATTKLTYILKKPLSGIKNPYIVACFVIVIGAVLKIFIATGPALVALLIGTFFPILLDMGLSYGAACAAMLVYMMGSYGPVEPTAATAASLMGFEINSTMWFVNTQLPIVGIILVITLIVYVISSKIIDKKEKDEAPVEIEPIADPQVPGIYALFPLFPVILMVIFSPLLVKTISMSVNTAIIISLFVVIALVKIFNIKKSVVSEVLSDFFDAFGNNMRGLGLTIILAMSFAALLNSVGGLKVIAELLGKANIPSVILVEVICLLGAFISMVTGSFFGALSIIAPLAASLSGGISLPIEVLASLILVSVSVGTNCTPINPGVLTITGSCKIESGKLIKRIAPVCWSAMIIGIVVVCLVMGN